MKSVIIIAIAFVVLIPIAAFAQGEIPNWVRNNASWWSEGLISDSDYVSGIQYLMQEGLLSTNTIPDEFPSHLKTDSKSWAEGKISDKEYLLILENWIESYNQKSVNETYSSSPTTETQTVTSTIKPTKNTELESINSIYQKISNVLSNTDYSLDEPTVVPFDDGSIKTGYIILGPDGHSFGGVNIWSDNNYVKRLEIATSHFNDFDSKSIAVIALAGMIKAVMNPNEYDIELFTEMFAEASSDFNYETKSIRTTPSGHKVTVNYVTIVEGVPGLTVVTFDIGYTQTLSEILDEKEPEKPKIPDWVKNIFLWYGQDKVSEDELLNAIKYLINEKILVLN